MIITQFLLAFEDPFTTAFRESFYPFDNIWTTNVVFSNLNIADTFDLDSTATANDIIKKVLDESDIPPEFHSEYKPYVRYKLFTGTVKLANGKEVRFDNVAKSIKKNEQRIYHVEKTLPEKIRKVVGHIEFARPLDNK